MRAKYVRRRILRNGDVELTYNFKGEEYTVIDYRCSGYSKTLKEQHEYEQKRIDELIENRNKPILPYDNKSELAFDDFMNFFE